MNFNSETDKEKFKLMYGKSYESLTSEELDSIYLDRFKYIKQRLNFRKSQIQKQNWRKYRFNYQIGLDRYYRSPAGKDVRKRLMDLIRNSYMSMDGFDVRLKDKAEFYSLVVSVQSDAISRCSDFMLEDTQADYILFMESVSEAVREWESYFFYDKPLSQYTVEVFLNLLRSEWLEASEENVNKILSEDISLLEVYLNKENKNG